MRGGRRRITWCGIGLVAAVGLTLIPSHQRTAAQLRRPFGLQRVAHTGFLKFGRALYSGWAPGLPSVPGYFLWYRGRYRPIYGAHSLVGHVRVRTPEQAREYARIVGASRADGEDWVELLPPRADAAMYGHVLSEGEWRANHLTMPSASRSGGGFVVGRWAFRRRLGRVTAAAHLSESVTRDGHLTRTVTAERDLKEAEIHGHGIM